MDNANIIDFIAYRNYQENKVLLPDSTVSEDLAIAIQLLIQRLREENPLNTQASQN